MLTAYRDGSTQIVMSAQEFMQRLAALVPRPRLHLTRYHRVLAPNARRAWQFFWHPQNTTATLDDRTVTRSAPVSVS